MSRSMSEKDWKVFRKLRTIALDRFYERALTEIAAQASDQSLTWHQRYLAVYQLIRQWDKELGYAFNGLSRSRALLHLLAIQAHELLTEEEISQFSLEIRDAARTLAGKSRS